MYVGTSRHTPRIARSACGRVSGLSMGRKYVATRGFQNPSLPIFRELAKTVCSAPVYCGSPRAVTRHPTTEDMGRGIRRNSNARAIPAVIARNAKSVCGRARRSMAADKPIRQPTLVHRTHEAHEATGARTGGALSVASRPASRLRLLRAVGSPRAGAKYLHEYICRVPAAYARRPLDIGCT